MWLKRFQGTSTAGRSCLIGQIPAKRFLPQVSSRDIVAGLFSNNPLGPPCALRALFRCVASTLGGQRCCKAFGRAFDRALAELRTELRAELLQGFGRARCRAFAEHWWSFISVDSDPRRENPPYLLQTPEPISGWHRHT